MISALVLGTAAITYAQTMQNTQNAPRVVVGKQLTAQVNTPAPGATAENPTQKRASARASSR